MTSRRRIVREVCEIEYHVRLEGKEFFVRRTQTSKVVKIQVWESITGIPRHNITWWV